MIKNINRRGFFRTGITGAAGIMALSPAKGSTSSSNQENNFIYRTLGKTGLYCTGCSKCIGECPKNLPVPDLMRAYMYAYGYSSPAMAYSLLSELDTSDNPCKDCDTCRVECTKKFRIREKIAEISRLVNVPADFLT